MVEVQAKVQQLLEEVAGLALASADPHRTVKQILVMAGDILEKGLTNPKLAHDSKIDTSDAAKIDTSDAERKRESTRVSLDHGSLAKRLYDLRLLRNRFFDDPDLFGEPAWDIILDLFAAELRGEAICITSACIASNVPSTTALRWISVLEAKRLIKRWADPADARRSFVGLTAHGRHRLKHFCNEAMRIGLA